MNLPRSLLREAWGGSRQPLRPRAAGFWNEEFE